MKRYPFVIAAVVVALVLSLMIITASREEFSTDNTNWNGASQLKKVPVLGETNASGERIAVRALATQLRGKNSGALVMLNPEADFSQDDIASIKYFIGNGGGLLLANDFGNGNAVLDGLGIDASVRFNGSLLRDDANNWWDSEFPFISNFTGSNVTSGVQTVDFNYGTALDTASVTPSINVTVLALSANTSYVSDAPAAAAGNSSNVGQGERVVLAYLEYGKGQIVLCSDPSFFINNMLGRGDNERLYQDIIANLTRGDPAAPVLFDDSHRGSQPLGIIFYEAVNSNNALKYTVALSLIASFVGGAAALKVVSGRVRPDTSPSTEVPLDQDVIINDIVARHPGWSKHKIQELFKSARTRDPKR